MAFNVRNLHLLLDGIGGGSAVRLFSYATADSEATISGTDYFTNVAQKGVRVGDFISVSSTHASATNGPIMTQVVAVDDDGNATVQPYEPDMATVPEALAGTDTKKSMSPATTKAVADDLREEIAPQLSELGAEVASVQGLIGALSADATGKLTLAVEDFSYIVMTAAQQIIAGHRPGQAYTIYATDKASIEEARRVADPTYVAEVAVENYAQVTKDENGEITDARLSGARHVLRGPNAMLATPYTAGTKPLDHAFYLGSNDLSIQSLVAPHDPFCISNTLLGQSYGPAGANGDFVSGSSGPLKPVFSSPARDPGVYTMSNATGGTFFRVSTSDAPFGSPNIKDLEAIDYYSGETRVVSEGILPEMFNQIGVMQQEAMGFKTKQHIVASGRGGWSINWLKPGSPQYKAVLRQHEIDREFMVAAGLIPIPGAIIWMQGEEDYNTPAKDLVPAYHAAFEQLHRDICAIYGVVTPMKVTVYCPMRGPYGSDAAVVCQSTMAYFELMRLYPGTYGNAGPAFAGEHASDQHLTGKGYRQLGAMKARAWFDLVFGGGPALPMYVDGRPIRLSSDGTEWLLPVNVPRGASILRQSGTSPIGNPASNAASNYIGGTPAGGSDNARFARDGGIWATDYRGLSVGVAEAKCGVDIPITVGDFVGGHKPLYIKLATVPTQGCSLQIAAFSQSGSSGGTQEDGPRNLFYASSGADFSIPTTYPDADPETFPTRLCPQTVELPL